MKKLAACVVLILCASAATAAARAANQPGPGAEEAGEEFLGPFKSWKNVKTDYGAIGDGKADDTAAIQRGLDDLRLHRQACVLYFPAGTYRITNGLKTERKAHQECMGISVVGEDPASTVIRWDGPADGTMLQYDAWYSKISRLTLDGAGKAAVALQYGPHFSTYNETSDMVFQDVALSGMLMGGGKDGKGQAENEVLRCTFRRCARDGLRTVQFNSMDIWVWYCRFEDCGHGLVNGAGNFHANHCLFLRSKGSDIATHNLMVFSFLNNTSIGSMYFIDFAGQHTWGSPTSITGNRIIEPTGEWAIRLSNGGPYLVMDNVVKTRPGQTTPTVQMTVRGDQTFLGNTYTYQGAVKEQGRNRRIAEKVVAASTIDAAPPELPATPARRARRVFDLAPTADAAAIQQALNEAAKLRGQRPVVHLPMGTYKLKQTLVIPAGSDVQLAGDGAAETATVLEWAGKPAGLMIRLEGPSRTTIRDLSLHASGADGLRIENCDQPGGRIFADQLNASGMQKCEACVRVNGVEQSDVLLRCAQGGGMSKKWIDVIGGPRRKSGQSVPGQVTLINGATGTSEAQYSVTGGGRLVVRGVYHEMDAASPQGLLLDDSGSLAIDATRFSYKTAADRPLIAVHGFRGNLALATCSLTPVNSTHTARVAITGNGSHTRVLCADTLFWVQELGVTADTAWLNQSQPAAEAALLGCNINSGLKGATKAGGFEFLDNRGEADDQFVTELLQPLRDARVWLPGETPSNLSDVRLHRVICRAGKDRVGVELVR